MKIKIQLPKILDANSSVKVVGHEELRSLAFKLGDAGDFVSTRAYQIIQKQITDPDMSFLFQHSFSQAQDLNNFERVEAQLNSL